MKTKRMSVEITKESDIISARRTGRQIARCLGFGLVDQIHLTTVISELTSNILLHAGCGFCHFEGESDRDVKRVVVIAEDNGPGINDSGKVLNFEKNASGNVGVGLAGIKRLGHEFTLTTEPGYTEVKVVICKDREWTACENQRFNQVTHLPLQSV